MPDKKSEEPPKSPEETALEQHVDEMMDPSKEPKAAKVSTEPVEASEASKIAAEVNKKLTNQTAVDLKTAPELPGKKLKEAKLNEVAEDAGHKVAVTVNNSVKAEAEPESGPETESEPVTEDLPVEDPVAEEGAEDSETAKAVDDIIAKEGDTLLAIEDAKVARKAKKATSSGGGWKDKLRALAKNKKTWAVVALLLILVLAIPTTRYKVLGLAVKRPVTITIVDSKTKTPVSSAQLELGGATVKTDADGKAKFNAAIGPRELTVKKQYYKTLRTAHFVGFKSKASSVKLEATGRLVPISVVNKVTGKPVAGVVIKVLNTTSKTNSKGEAIIALPTTASTNPGKLSLSGYNSSQVTVEVTDEKVKANNFELTPSGHVYFLSNRTGKLDVVRTNLDGSDRKVILEGTGNEDKNTTSLLASRDWRYLVLKSRRDTPQAALYLVDTSNDKVTQFDSGDANFELVGWYDHNFIYSITRNNLSNWQANRQALKAYDAERQQLNLLDQNQAEGDANHYAFQNFFNFYIVKNAIVYNTQWQTHAVNFGTYDKTGKNDTIRAVQPTGQNKKDYQSFPTANTGYISASLYEPQGVYFAVNDSSTNKTSFYEFEDQAVKTANTDLNTFNQTYPTFLVSPSSKQTFWTELRDGKNALFTGDPDANNKKQIASLSQYSPYGWFTDNYVLVSKNSSELYIAGPSSLSKGRQPIKITDYYKPAQTYPGYGYGYGGL